MARPKNPLPTKHHKGEARYWVGGRWLSLGPWDSPASRAEFARVCAEVVASSAATVAVRTMRKAFTVNELVAAFNVTARRIT